VLEDGTVWRWGGTYGLTPVQYVDLVEVESLVDADDHLCAIKTDHTLWCWGSNSYGQLGNGLTGGLPTEIPSQVIGLSDVTSVAGSDSCTCASTASGEAWCWGADHLTTAPHPTPVQVTEISGVRVVAMGYRLTCAIVDPGDVYCWGVGDFGQLGNGSTEDSATPVKVSKLEQVVHLAKGGSVAITADGTLWGWGRLGPDGTLPLAAKETEVGIERGFDQWWEYYATVPFPFADPR
jgi:alpha-tubulin suppressor-like RCC1 family protein